MKILFTSLLAVAASGLCLPALAQDQASYLDDRSDGPALVRSLYNAINRKEYARAYSYFDDRKGTGDYKSFVEGYAGTVDVQVTIGTAKPEGAAGSIYAPVPVAVKSTEKGGKEQVFAGCYVTRIVNPGIQEPPFAPLHIESAALKAVELPFEKALPATCPPPS
jgi:hypothetical protein